MLSVSSVRSAASVAIRSRPLSAVAVASTPSSALFGEMAIKKQRTAARKSAPLGVRPKKVTSKKPKASEGASSAATAKGLVVGGKFPSLGKLETEQEGEFVDLDEVLKTTGIALFAYPKANTSGCTVQAIGFNDSFAAFEKAGYRVFGISADSPTTQKNWKTKHSFQYNLLCDRSFSALKKLGWAKAGGGVVRSHALIGKGGVVKDVVSPVSSKDSVNLALEALEAP